MSIDTYKFSEERKAQPNFSMTETAKFLDTPVSTISKAVKRGTIETVETNTGRKRIPASEVIKYANKTNKNVEKVAREVKQVTGGSNKQLLSWILVGLGLYFLMKYIR